MDEPDVRCASDGGDSDPNTPSRRRRYSERSSSGYPRPGVIYNDHTTRTNEYGEVPSSSRVYDDGRGAPVVATTTGVGSSITYTDARGTTESVVVPQGGVIVQVPAADGGYRLGLFGWRRRCLYVLLLFLTVTVTLNLALTLFFMRVLDFSSVSKKRFCV